MKASFVFLLICPTAFLMIGSLGLANIDQTFFKSIEVRLERLSTGGDALGIIFNIAVVWTDELVVKVVGYVFVEACLSGGVGFLQTTKESSFQRGAFVDGKAFS